MSEATAVLDAPEVAPVVVGDARVELADLFLRGDGLEVGALHLAMVLPVGARARYVDRMSVVDLRAHYPELAGVDLAPVEVIDDGERLETIEPESVDFIVANHFLEHCEDPIRTIETHLGKLRPGGVLFYAVPDKRYTFDFRRPRTPLEHVIADHEHGAQRSRGEHYLEWARLVHEGTGPPEEPQAVAHARQLEAEAYSIHFHVWTQADLVRLMLHCHERLGSFEIEAVRRRGIENIVVLRKHGELSLEPPAELAPPVTELVGVVSSQPVPPAAGVTPAPGSARVGIPLSALRVTLDESSAQSYWSIDPDGVPGRALVMATGAPVTVPLGLDGVVTLSARVRLLPHDWRDGRGVVRAWVAATQADGTRRELWSGSLPAAADLGSPEGLAVTCELEPGTTSLQLGLQQLTTSDRAVARAVWVQPEIIDPQAAPPPPTAADSPLLTPPPTDRRLISVLTPVHDPPIEMLHEAIDSVRSQTFTDWELCLIDDGSTNPEIITTLQHYADTDSRIHLQRRDTPGGISDATNAALALATGHYIALLDHDDTLTPDALAHIAHQIATQPNLDMIYTDEAVMDASRRIATHAKPGWSPESLVLLMYTCHLGVYRRTLAMQVGGFRSEFDGCQDYDFVLRLVERTDRVAHIPHVLYHWRAHPSSTAGGDAKPYAYVAQPRAIAGHLRRLAVNAEIQYGPLPGVHRLVHRVPESLTVSFVLAVTDAHGLAQAAASWIAQPHQAWNVILTAPANTIDDCTHALKASGLSNHRITTLTTHPDHDLPTALATAAQAADHDHLLLLNTPAIGLTNDWLTRLLGYSNQPHIAAAGPVVLAPNGRIQEAGIAIPNGTPLPLLHGATGAEAPPVATNLSAVSGVLATSRAIYHQLGGLNPQLGDLAPIDYCLRAHDQHLRIVTVPDARLQATTPDPTTNHLPNLRALRHHWTQTHTHDPYYNPTYRTDRGDFRQRNGD